MLALSHCVLTNYKACYVIMTNLDEFSKNNLMLNSCVLYHKINFVHFLAYDYAK